MRLDATLREGERCPGRRVEDTIDDPLTELLKVTVKSDLRKSHR